MKKESKTWSPPGRPWELELLAFIFVLTSLVIPLYVELSYDEASPERIENLSLVARAEMERNQDQPSWKDLTMVFWGIAIVGLYLVHLVMAGAAFRWNSTPFTYLFAPLIFAMITYYRLFWLSQRTNDIGTIVSGGALEISMWILGILSITFLVARVRMARYRIQFRNVEWDIVSSTKLDKTYFELCANFTPLVYPPREYRVCEHGLMIEGWLFLMPLPFELIHSVEAAKHATYLTSGHYVATSAKTLLRIQLNDTPNPIFISPVQRKEMLEYCEKILAPRHGGTWAGATKSGDKQTRHGAATETHPGLRAQRKSQAEAKHSGKH
ncbi:MAG: hypothetical protein EOM20_01390 [Spartobacteria bacterium]|nr:hypothetical protein [Spartobacteria bacterium]